MQTSYQLVFVCARPQCRALECSLGRTRTRHNRAYLLLCTVPASTGETCRMSCSQDMHQQEGQYLQHEYHEEAKRLCQATA